MEKVFLKTLRDGAIFKLDRYSDVDYTFITRDEDEEEIIIQSNHSNMSYIKAYDTEVWVEIKK